MATKKAKVWGAWCKGTYTYIKAYQKLNAVKKFKTLDPSIKATDVKMSTMTNSHQAAVDA